MPHRAGSGGSNGKGKGGKSSFVITWPIYMQVKSLRTEADRLQEEMTRQARHRQELEDFIEKMWHDM